MAVGDPWLDDEMPELVTDYVRWVDTDVMIADPMTKVMEPDKLQEALDSNYWNFEQPIESVLKKRAKQLKRKKTAVSDGDTAPADSPYSRASYDSADDSTDNIGESPTSVTGG